MHTHCVILLPEIKNPVDVICCMEADTYCCFSRHHWMVHILAYYVKL